MEKRNLKWTFEPTNSQREQARFLATDPARRYIVVCQVLNGSVNIPDELRDKYDTVISFLYPAYAGCTSIHPMNEFEPFDKDAQEDKLLDEYLGLA